MKGTRRKERRGLDRDSTERIALTRTTTKHITKLAQLNACHASRGSFQAEPDVVDEDSHALESARSPRCAPQKPEGEAHGAGNKEIQWSIWLSRIQGGGTDRIMPNSPTAMGRAGPAEIFEAHGRPQEFTNPIVLW